MSSPVKILEVPSQPTAVVRGLTTAANLPERIRALFDEFYANFKTKGGLNIVFYPTWDVTGEFEIECGVQVDGQGNSSTPAGKVATIVHMGPYSKLKSSHDEIHRYVQGNGHKLTGQSWEVYGHHTDDLAQLRTDIFYLLVH